MSDEFAALCEAWLDGTLDASGRERLIALMASDATRAQALVEANRQHLGLHALMGGGDQADRRARIDDLIDAAAPAGRQRRVAAIVSKLPRSGRTGRFHRRDPARPWFAAVSAAAALVACLAGGMWLSRSSPLARIEGVGVLVRLGERLPIATGLPMRDGDAIEAAGGDVSLNYADGSVLMFRDGTRATLHVDAGGKRVELAQGAVRASVTAQPAGRPLRLVAAGAEAEVLGTELIFATGADLARVSVLSGSVRLSAIGGAVQVSAGQTAVARAGSMPEAHASADLTRGLLGWWSFDEREGEQAADRSAAGRHARASRTRIVDGLSGRARRFDGALGGDSYVQATAIPMAGVDALSVSAWVRTTSPFFGTVVGDVFTVGWGAGNERFKPQDMPPDAAQHAGLVNLMHAGDDTAHLDSRTRVDDGRWHHLLWNWRRGGEGRIYIDGRLSASGPLTAGRWPADAWTPVIGSGGGHREWCFGGDIDEVRIYAGALDEDAIAQLAAPPGE